jgi:hypothetical protein
MSTCQCKSKLHNHVAGECPNDVEGEGDEKCGSCKEKDKQLQLAGLLEAPVAAGPPPDRNLENLIVAPPEKPDQ